MKKLFIVGMGPGPFSMITQGALSILKEADTVFVQTKEHPVVSKLVSLGIHVDCLDKLYEDALDFDELNQSLVTRALEAVKTKNTALAVSGHGLIAQSVMAPLMTQAMEQGVEILVHPGIGYEDAALAACKLSAAEGYVLHIGTVRMDSVVSEKINIVVDLDTRLRASEAKVALMKRFSDDTPVHFVQCDGDEYISRSIALFDIDRQETYDASTVLVLKAQPLLEKQRFTASDLIKICRILRAPDGCPWDREQTHHSIRKNMMEECCEAMAAISEGDDEHLCEELGDVLLQIALHATMAEEDGSFDLYDIATGICTKMIRRHPHIFGTAKADTSAQVLQNWEIIKETERNGKPKNKLKKVGEGLPALMRAQELQKKLVGKTGDMSLAQEALMASIAQLNLPSDDPERQEKAAGEALWSLCEWLRQKDVHAETALSDECMAKVEHYGYEK